ncbi:anthranilate synthase component I [Methanoregula formicica]|uniref:Anthranilate synthase component 1 n=1 Tax=Methanoregula formicica (strain DSM 22288 / NBRC 105244 / SMSP) TaxID=593750 RepID=L0HJA8_METFS|nr:anthranilate synthase component I [Methanoregula formicica]AGB03866.1 anthranilate synthase component I [Methanoregula formicica SMSP]
MTQKLILNLGLDEFITAVKTQPKPLIIPLCAELPLPDISPLVLYEGTTTGCGFLLESMEGSEKLARYSFIGIEPEMIVTVQDTVEIAGNEPFTSIAQDPDGTNPVDRIQSILSRFHYMNVKAPRFFGGMVGYFAYDCVYSLFDNVKRTTKKATGLPDSYHDARFMLTKDCIVIDHRDKRMYLFSSPFLTYDSDLRMEYEQCTRKIQALADRIAGLVPRQSGVFPPSTKVTPSSFGTSVSQQTFEQAVTDVKSHIVAGDIFQAVLSRRLDFPVPDDPFAVYAALREINPSPYMYYLDFGEEKIIGASPEMLVRVERRQVTTVPIAGTRPRGRTAEEDTRLEKELLMDKKERAEHTMLVDLARNDLGRVCRFGSVQVSEFMGIEKFSHVQHIVSTVSGTLRDNLDCYDAFKSCFPAGTVSGAPKIRAMQIIDEQEPEKRGLYAGAVGYIGFDRNLDFAIAIRTIQVINGRAYVQVGAGIVADSVPENEWKETENKAAAMIRAIERSGACS